MREVSDMHEKVMVKLIHVSEMYFKLPISSLIHRLMFDIVVHCCNKYNRQ